MGRMIIVLSVSALMVALTASAAFAATKYGTAAGDGLYGTPQADTIYGFGGADLVYGYGGADTLYGGNEVGFGDKILGGNANDRVLGQAGDDALYGESGDDTVNGGAGKDRVVGGLGGDILNGGFGSDLINARDGQKDTIVFCINEDTVYYDARLDVLRDSCVSPQGTASKSASQSSLVAKQPPKGLFEHTGKVLVKHEDEEQCVAAKELKVHLKHGDEIVNPAGCSSER